MLPNSGITTTLVANELGVSTHSVSQLCTSSNINIFSKYKPVKWPYTNVDGVTDRWRSVNGNCGILVPDATSLPSSGPMAKWQHDKPRGGSSEPYRLGDFRGYNHSAPAFFKMYPDPAMRKGEAFKCSIMQNQAAEINIKDIKVLSQSYIGIVVRHTSTGELRFVTLTTDVASMSANEYLLSVDIPKNWPNGNVEVYMVGSMISVPTVQTSIGTTVRSLNQEDGNEGYRVFVLKDEEPDRFSVDYDVEPGSLPGEYEITFSVTSIKGTFWMYDVTMVLSSEPAGNVIPMGTVTSGAGPDINIMTGQTYTFPPYTVHVINSSINSYVNVDPTYRGTVIGGFSILFRAK